MVPPKPTSTLRHGSRASATRPLYWKLLGWKRAPALWSGSLARISHQPLDQSKPRSGRDAGLRWEAPAASRLRPLARSRREQAVWRIHVIEAHPSDQTQDSCTRRNSYAVGAMPSGSAAPGEPAARQGAQPRARRGCGEAGGGQARRGRGRGGGGGQPGPAASFSLHRRGRGPVRGRRPQYRVDQHWLGAISLVI